MNSIDAKTIRTLTLTLVARILAKRDASKSLIGDHAYILNTTFDAPLAKYRWAVVRSVRQIMLMKGWGCSEYLTPLNKGDWQLTVTIFNSENER